MATIKSHTSLEQSRKLAEILPHESADMIYVHTTDIEGNEHYNIDFRNINPLFENDICAWSLAALISVLPQLVEFKGNKYYLRFMKEYVEYANDEISITGKCLHTIGNDNLVDACVEMIIKLHEQNLL